MSRNLNIYRARKGGLPTVNQIIGKDCERKERRYLEKEKRKKVRNGF